MSALRIEADEAQEKVEELKGTVKKLEQENLAKEQEITSLTHRNQLLEGEVEKLETSLKEAKDAASQSAQHDTQNEALQRRMQLLEEEAEDATGICGRQTRSILSHTFPPFRTGMAGILTFGFLNRLRQTDVKAGHYERKVQALESARDEWESKYEEMAKKYAELQKELHDLEVSISNV
ncbi:hypothetical protein ARAM_003937 [Aspergillus rambellii]|uniref:Tropomyosin n=1 Tax=Aspergillus rambellii TaxID=308745 RepID=A0A0F8UDD1_9EURO|nr:hypothetical protein ARAM_003937 [Aspergillus rambellii]